MRMSPHLTIGLGLLAGLLTLPAVAAGNGCLVQGSLTGNGIHQVMHYCAANKGMTATRFAEHCKELHAAQLADLDPADARKFSLKTLAACPGNFKASCDGAFSEKMNLQYMADDSMLKDGNAKLFCQSMDGTWRQTR